MTHQTTTIATRIEQVSGGRAASGPVASLLFARRTLLKIRHVPEQLGDVLLIPILFTLLFTYMFGGALAGSTGDYLQYLLPGTLAMTVVMITMFTGITLNTDVASGAFDRFRSLPIWRPAPLVGALLGDAGRYLLASGLVVGLGLLMGFRPEAGVSGLLLAIGLVVVFAFSVSWVWTALALVLRTPQAVSVSGTLVMFPLAFVSNVFVDPSTMPGWLQVAVNLNPLTHLVSAARGLMHGTPVGAEVAIVLVSSAALVVIFGALTVRLYAARR